jgi:hypothetical protein
MVAVGAVAVQHTKHTAEGAALVDIHVRAMQDAVLIQRLLVEPHESFHGARRERMK